MEKALNIIQITLNESLDLFILFDIMDMSYLIHESNAHNFGLLKEGFPSWWMVCAFPLFAGLWLFCCSIPSWVCGQLERKVKDTVLDSPGPQDKNLWGRLHEHKRLIFSSTMTWIIKNWNYRVGGFGFMITPGVIFK